ncbi:MAG: T9SS type A sorting domain-containing protein, partial [Cyclobacteriaceae bacterium]|nr:T9SS type A sorting domain-containing protein [Cyclobacteriaceae bacterium]
MVSTELKPDKYVLHQNYPNPFNPNTIIKFALPQDSKVNLTVFNILGEKVVQLINQEMKAGYHEYKFDASNFASGVYLYSITAGEFIEIKKMVLMK